VSRTMTVTFFVWLALGVACWLATLALAATLNNSDQAGNGLSYAFAMIGIVMTWSIIAFLLVLAFRSASAPGWVITLAVVATPLSAASAMTVVNLLKGNRDFAGQWPIAALVVAPLLLMLFAVWATRPGMHALVSPRVMFPTVWLSIVALSIIPFPLRAAQKKRQAKQRQTELVASSGREVSRKQAWQTQFDALTDSAHLREVLAFASNESNMRDVALAKARTLSNRQQNALQMLQQGETALMSDLRNLALNPTPELCTLATEFLRLHAVNYQGRAVWDDKRFVVAAQELDKYLYGMQWLAEGGCSLRTALDAYRVTAQAYDDSPERAQFLARLDVFATTAARATLPAR